LGKYGGLYMDVTSQWDCPSMTDQTEVEAVRRLRFKLPIAYTEILRDKNGGLLNRTHFPLHIAHMETQARIQVLFGLGGTHGMDADKDGSTWSDWFIGQWDYPQNCIVFSQFGAAGWLLQYDSDDLIVEPRVVHAYCDCIDGPLLTAVSDNFEAFVSQLR